LYATTARSTRVLGRGGEFCGAAPIKE
jgi:hypothetical protein